jgi:hypothetical protein
MGLAWAASIKSRAIGTKLGHARAFTSTGYYPIYQRTIGPLRVVRRADGSALGIVAMP